MCVKQNRNVHLPPKGGAENNMRDIITSRQNPTIIKICKLSDKKNREADRLFRFDGLKLYAEACSAGIGIEYILLRESSAAALRGRINTCGAIPPEQTGAQVLTLADRLFDSVSEEKSPEGIITAAKYIDKSHKIATIDYNLGNRADILPLSGEKIIMLDDIRDPGNLGTILRSAAALGLETVILAGECADIYNPKTIRAAMGAVFKIKTIACRDTLAYIGSVRAAGRRVLASALGRDAVSLVDISLRGDDCVVVGNEGHGLSRDVIDACETSIVIPMAADSDSLNAAAAAAIFIWEVSKV